MEKKTMKNDKVLKDQNALQTMVVREFEPADKPHVQRIFYEGLMEMIPDTAFRGLRHHLESLLLYTAMTVLCFVITMCWWVIGLLPAIVLCGRYFYSRRVIHGYLERAMNGDMADIEGFYMKSPDSCLWVAVLEGKVVGVVAAVGRQKVRRCCRVEADSNVDKFNEPLAVANLRGDIQTFDKQFKFLCQTSAAIYIFCDESETDYFKHLESKDVKGNVILISSFQGKSFTLKMMTMGPQLKITDITQKKKTDAELTKALNESISRTLEKCPSKVSVENLVDTACMYGFLVDENSEECKSARENANAITKDVCNTSEFKEKQLIYQGHIWKVISWLETECWRLRKVGNRGAEDYRTDLIRKEKGHRRRQQQFEMTAAISSFIDGISSEVQCYYFLKWLEMNLDNLSREELSVLKDRYKELSQTFPQDCEKIAEIDKQISVRSLCLDHFFRECGQLYECVDCLPEHSQQRKNIQQLPALCAQMLLDGFPLELVDGDVANIPMKWITEVLTQLHYILQSSSKVKVITIIGAENSGKSTLLNTMFGVRFAVSKGRCTRGAFIQVITVNKDISEALGCDCIIIIDTEGLKSHQLVQADHSHERDKEVASLAVALSDATIISISKDTSSEEDILEKVLHAFTRVKDVGIKPLCHFVYSNMSDMERTGGRRTGEELMVNLNQMIQKDIRMKKANVTKISDVMEFDPDTCSRDIPPLWDGTPPMAHFSVEYSETARALKMQLIRDLKKCEKRGDLTHFTRRLKSYWKAV
ncbi:Interferon-induced very large GTPase 1 [Nibea albiflora]|uniref:Interferon-induced very large GTPase 1 n=1 Tax=Nibea albiflora TaxID=240163 RepID=A0ACB7FLQ7_NIBAL|nr:Interferon-induced very large GTPase 1 [Nibea albiflora]